jgi:hypothetical protein
MGKCQRGRVFAEGYQLPVGCKFTGGAPLIRVVHANFVEAIIHDWFRVSEVHKVDEELQKGWFLKLKGNSKGLRFVAVYWKTICE